MQDQIEKDFRRFCSAAQDQKEANRANLFFNFARRAFRADPKILRTIDDLTGHGAETRFVTKTQSGFADFASGYLLIEFKRDLSTPAALKKAENQLWRYFRSHYQQEEESLFGVGDEVRFYQMIATDGLIWRVYGVNFHSFGADGLPVDDANRGMVKQAEFSAIAHGATAFRQFLKETLFAAPKRQRLSAENIHRDFGVSSPLYYDAYRALSTALPNPEDDSEAAIAYREWRDYFSRVYGSRSKAAGLKEFYLHTYLATFAKILGWHFIRRKTVINKIQMCRIITGEAFTESGIDDFAGKDFFAWVADARRIDDLHPTFMRISNALANYIFDSPRHDLLQGVYQDIVDADTRHALGEYYTPDWLCERMVRRVNPSLGAKVLDPACGSGSFLRAVVAHKKEQDSALCARDLAAQVVGMDIHPAAVQLAKTNLLLSLPKRKPGERVRLRVYLANTLTLFSGGKLIGENHITLKLRDFDGKRGKRGDADSVPLIIQDDARWLYEEAISFCDSLSSESDSLSRKDAIARFIEKFDARAQRASDNFNLKREAEQYAEVHRRMAAAKRTKQNSIWRYVLLNLMQPLILRGEFDHIVGNPPWLTFKDIENAEYQREIESIAKLNNLLPGAQNKTHLEMATLFVSHCARAFLKGKGDLSFVMSASVLDQGNHEPIRSGRAHGIAIKEIWNLSAVKPLFNIACMVLFTDRDNDEGEGRLAKYQRGFAGETIAANLPERDSLLAIVEEKADARKVHWHLKIISGGGKAKKTMFSDRPPSDAAIVVSKYKFKQGATMFPRSFVFVESTDGLTAQDIAECAAPIRIKTADRGGAKQPWNIKLNGEAAPACLFQTAIGEHLFPFYIPVTRLAMAHLPLQLGENPRMLTPAETENDAQFQASAKWFKQCENLWKENRTERNTANKVSQIDYLNWRNKMINQPYHLRYMVLYNASGKHLCAAVFDRENAPLPFVAESKTYYFASDSADECVFLAAVLNAPLSTKRITANVRIDIHKRVMALPIPKFRADNKLHKVIVAMSRRCEKKAAEFADEINLNDPYAPPGGRSHGHKRSLFRKHLGDELARLDSLVRRLFDGA